MFKIYGYATQNSKKVLYVAEELGIDYEFEKVDLRKGESRTEDFAKKNIMRKVPVLQHDERFLFESGAICRYLANIQESKLYPCDKFERAVVDQWMDFFSTQLGRWLNTLFFEKLMKPLFNLGTPIQSVIDESSKFVRQNLKTVNFHLENNRYFAGPNFSIADLFAYAYIEQLIPLEFPLEEYPHVANWLNKIAARASIKKGPERLA